MCFNSEKYKVLWGIANSPPCEFRCVWWRKGNESEVGKQTTIQNKVSYTGNHKLRTQWKLICSCGVPILLEDYSLQKAPTLRVGQVCSQEKLKHSWNMSLYSFIHSFIHLFKCLLSISVHQNFVSLSEACASEGSMCCSPITEISNTSKRSILTFFYFGIFLLSTQKFCLQSDNLIINISTFYIFIFYFSIVLDVH